MKISELKKSGHAPSLLASFLYFDISFMIWVLLGALGVYITKDFGLSPAEKGLIVAIPILGGSFFRIVLGFLTDRIGPRKTAIGGMLVTMIPLFWGWLFGESLAELYLIGILLGVAGASFAAALPMASRWYPPHLQGLAMGIAGAGNSGTLFATLFGPRLAESLGWHNVMGLALIPLTIVFIIYILIAKDAPSQPPAKPLKEYFNVFKITDTWYFCILYSVTFGGFVGFTSFLSIFFVDEYGLTRIRAGEFVTLCVIAGSFFRPVGGFIADKIGGVKLLMFLFIGLTICMFGISFLYSLTAVTILLFIGMLFLGMGNGAVFQLVPQRFSKEIGFITGIVGAAGGVGGFLVPNILGTLKQITGTYATGFLVFSAVGIVALLILGLAQLSWRKTWVLGKNSVKI
ncbi:nitrate/nitrite transporter [Peribacillus frigoritolerans]|jgi:MFS transporter, NNP family, nitrate/nitrite transporter|uniref:Nitrate/nitrite transporter n=1 Tax=Peribacillus frigoritolerans TaxID=450367 RepID=A0AAJ1QN49_9BACI|nr:nitrate/nitrite transporter [Peribacillus frigoritolerans]KOR82960.1 MFS transporter [Bacillus sp. FJAT-22058]QNK47167.1 NarK/NasA family nitrate transporter [Brevibacterium sp. PAMC23299]QYF80630.1 NarK/NasA family nitrate transporter [Brevibacterium sp. PAMC21349]MCK2018072.1 NarK/NasA family nitrate transporter [Peribacillus frigoritolerans]MCU6599434.1 NarK/NasA family nitrate transporter [Peribacillus frigoritolerans]